MVLDGKTKMILGGTILGIFAAMVFTGHMTPEQFQDKLVWLFGIFSIGRGLEHVGKGIGKNGHA